MLRSGRQTLPATFKELQAFLPKVDKCSEACKHLSLPIAVMMAGSDTLIMQHQIQASAKYFGVEPIILPGLAHDIMLVGFGCCPCLAISVFGALPVWYCNVPVMIRFHVLGYLHKAAPAFLWPQAAFMCTCFLCQEESTVVRHWSFGCVFSTRSTLHLLMLLC